MVISTTGTGGAPVSHPDLKEAIVVGVEEYVS